MSMFSKPGGLPHDSTLEEKMREKPNVRDSGIEAFSIHKSRLVPSKNQPRKFFSKETITERRLQMENDGQLSPITVYEPFVGQDGEQMWPIHDGECRWRGAMESNDEKLEYLRAELYQGDPANVFITLVSQLMHNDEGSAPLSNVEKGVAYKTLVEEKKRLGSDTPLNDVAQLLGKQISHVSELLQIAEMPEEMIDFSLKNGITDARVLSGMMQVHKRGGGSHQLIEDLVQGIEESKPLREIVKTHVQKVKGKTPAKKAGKKKEKPTRLITATTVKVKRKESGGQLLTIETSREIINVHITDEHLSQLS